MANEINKRLEELKTSLSPKVMTKFAYNKFYSVTPIRSGNARNHTNLKNDKIEADYPYAQRLDEGYSKQFGGRGMTQPTIEYIKSYIKSLEKK
jgi:hypothetical protein